MIADVATTLNQNPAVLIEISLTYISVVYNHGFIFLLFFLEIIVCGKNYSTAISTQSSKLNLS